MAAQRAPPAACPLRHETGVAEGLRDLSQEVLVAQQILRNGKKTRTRTLPAGVVNDFAGLPDFTQITLTDASGSTVLEKTEAFCPNNASGRVRPGTPRPWRWETWRR